MEKNNSTKVKEENQEQVVKKVEFPTSEHFAMEILKQEKDKSRAKNLGVIGLTIGFIGLAIATVTITIHLSNINYQNDCDWRKLFSDYDFISQDGEGINNANYGEQGDLNNGAKDKVEEESVNQ